ncbi:MAG: response regulator [Planctomycetaceae bacterium]|nr:response regulator [Planctomycetaceae bacterium]
MQGDRVMADCANHAFYRTFADHSCKMECWHAPDGRLVYVSPAGEHITGYTRQDFYSDQDLFLRIIHPQDRPAFEAHCSAAGTQNSTMLQDVQFRITRKDGQPRWLRLLRRTVCDRRGQVLAFRSTFSDITAQKQLEHQLQESMDLVQSVLDNPHLLVACMDRDFNFLRVNAAYAKADNRDVDFYPGKNYFELYPNDENKTIFQKVVQTDESYSAQAHKFEYAEHPERGEFYWDWNLVGSKDENGNTTRLVLTLADVTERKRAQDARQRMMERNETLVGASEDILRADNSDLLVKTIARTARVITQSSFALAENGRQEDAPSYRAFLMNDQMHPPCLNEMVVACKDRLYSEIIVQGRAVRFSREQLSQHRLFQDLPADHANLNGLIAVPLFNSRSSVNGLILVAHKEHGSFAEEDEAELKRLAAISSLAVQHLEAREQLTRERDRLDQRVRQRTDDLERTVRTLGEEVLQRVQVEADLNATNAELLQRAKRLSKMASDLTIAEHRERSRLAEVLHDGLQQILLAAKLELSIIAAKVSRAQRHAVDHVIELLKDSIHASRTLTVELYPPVLREAGIVGALEWLVRWMSERYGFKVELEKSDDVNIRREDFCIVVFQSIRELLFNAVKHAQVNEARVMIRQNGDFVEFTIRDEGKGFDPQMVSDSSETGGFGLFSIRERLRLLGGKLVIISAPQAGSTFVLTVPADVTLKPEEVVSVPKRRIETIGQPPGHAASRENAIRILLVDDHTVMRRGLATLLRQEPDMKVVGEAATGEEAIQLAFQLKPDVILMDFGLPGINGAETTRRICSELDCARVIGLSMFDEQDRAAAMFEAGASAYATKSESPLILLAAIRSVVLPLKQADHLRQDPSLNPEPDGGSNKNPR